MNWYEMAVVVKTIRVKAHSPEQAEEMYDRFHGSGKEITCPHHPEEIVGESNWNCGCAEYEDDVYHIIQPGGRAD